MEFNHEIRRIFLDDADEKKKLELFLKNEGIKLDKSVEYTVGIYEGEKLIATGSFFKNTLRCLAVSSEYQGQGLLNTVASHLINEQYQRGNTDIFVYTKGSAAGFFNDIGFYEIVRVQDLVVFMENRANGIKDYAEALSKKKINSSKVASIVVNGNPFTLGHQYLVEKAASENDVLHVFVVSEESSVIPFSVRYELIKRGTEHLKNVVLHKAGNYIVSSATFPSYFIKDEDSIVETHAKLDIEVFKRHIAPALGINRRYVGEEPYDEVTRSYNEVMKKSLEEVGIECRVIPRREFGEKAISASRVRALIRENNIEGIKDLVPSTTYEYLISKEAEGLIEKIKRTHGRH